MHAPLAQDHVEAPRVAVAERPETDADAAGDAGDGGEPTSTALVVRSTLGLALPRAFFVREDGVERPIALAATGACLVPRAPPFLVRASGHREVEVTEPGEVALEPVIGIVLRAPRLRERTIETRLLWERIETYPEHEDWALCGHPSDDAFAVAIDPRGRSVGGMPFGFVPIDLTTSDLRKIDVEVERHVEGTFEHELFLGEHAPATLALAPGRCPTGCEAPLERGLWSTAPPGPESVTTTAHPWGSLVVVNGLGAPRPAGPEERVVPGVEYGLGVRCPACGAYGRRFVEHVLLCDDAERILGLELLEGRHVAVPRVRRTLVVASGPAGLPGAPAELIAGVRWAGIEVPFHLRLNSPAPGRPVEWTLEWPADAESLWWTVGRDDPRRYVPLFAGIEDIELR